MSYVDAAVAPQRKTGQIKLHGPAAFEGMRKAGRLVAECLDMLTGEIGPGVPTETIDRLVLDFALAHKAVPATLMYRGYRKATCTSVNHVVCHGIPGEKPLKEGDIVNVDVTLILRSEEHTSELQSLRHLVCRLLLEKKKKKTIKIQQPITDKKKTHTIKPTKLNTL